MLQHLLTPAIALLTIAATPVLTRSYDNGRTGANETETVLTPQLVATKGLRRLKSLKVNDDPRIEAQPLYVPKLTMNDGKQHNVIFVATMGNNVFAFDADEHDEAKHLLWKTAAPLGTPFRPPETQRPGQHRSTAIDLFGVNISWGILSTPVIDLDANKMYLVNWMVQADGKPELFAHQLNLKDGKEIGTPQALKAILTDAQGHPVLDAHGKGVDLHKDQKVRTALLLQPLRGQHKTLFMATVGGENLAAPHGWVVAFDVDSFTQTAAWVSTPSSFGGGIWQAGQGLASDDQGNVYAVTSNGGYIALPRGQVNDFNGTTDFAEALVKLKYTKSGPGNAKLTLEDWFIPFRDSARTTLARYDYRDQDLGSGGAVLPKNTNLVLVVGKDGLLYVLDRGHFGKKVGDLSVLKSQPPSYVTFNGVGMPVADHIDFPLGDPTRNPGKTHHLHGTPVSWDGSKGPMLFTWGENESLRAWKLDTATGQVTFFGRGAEVASARLAADPNGIGGMPGGMLTVSSNGKTANTGIAWALAPIDGDANRDPVPGIARAYDAAQLDATPIDAGTPRLKLLWDSSRAGVGFTFSKFGVPVVADGKLLVPTYDGRVDVYVLNP